MADEPSWDEIFAPRTADRSAPATADATSGSGGGEPPTRSEPERAIPVDSTAGVPVSRRALRAQREHEERAREQREREELGRQQRDAAPTAADRASAGPTGDSAPAGDSAPPEGPGRFDPFSALVFGAETSGTETSGAQTSGTETSGTENMRPRASGRRASTTETVATSETVPQRESGPARESVPTSEAVPAPAPTTDESRSEASFFPFDEHFASAAAAAPDTTSAAVPDLAGEGGDGHGGGRGGGRGRSSKPPRARKPRGHHRGAWILAIVLVVVLGGGTAGGFAVWHKVSPGVSALFGAKPTTDYSGSGNGTKVTFTINKGDIGSTIATNLAKAGITKSYTASYKVLLASPDISFQPGSYSMYQHMSGASAIARLQDTSARLVNKLVIPEGTTLKGIIPLMATATKLSTDDVTAAANDYTAYGLPAGVTSLEGYLFPATYDLQPGKTAQFYFQEMVDTMKQHLAAAGVAPADYEHTIIFASLVQKEAGLAADYPKVARVFQNRIDQGMLLQSDATVAYGAGTTNRVTTTDAERADASNPYNTYVHPGLPVGPISNPGDLAINAVTHPADGTWLYFVTVNLQTGETAFSTTYSEHLAAVAQFQAWLRANPSYNQ